MGRGISNRNSNKLLTAAVASVAMAGLGATPTRGGLVIDLRAVSVTGFGNTIMPGGKVVPEPGVGETVTFGLYARISGTNTVQTVLNVNGDGSDLLTFNDDTLQFVTGSFQSVGSLKGNMAPVAGPITTPGFQTPASPFTASGMQNGTAQDWDSDGDLDIGAFNNNDLSQLFVGRGITPTQAAVDNTGSGPTKGYTQGAGGVQFAPNINETLIDPTTNEVRIGTLRWVETQFSPTFCTVNFVPRMTFDGALWFEDGITTAKNPTNAAISTGAPVTIAFVPEPSPVGLLATAPILGLLARRRRDGRL